MGATGVRHGVAVGPGQVPKIAEPYRPGPGLVARLRSDVTAAMTANPAGAGTAGAREEQAAQLITEALRADAVTRISSGRPPLTDVEERAVVKAVLDELFGLGRLQPLLDDERIENINVTGADTVHVRYADGSRARLAPIAGCDEELVGLIRLAAARLGVTERRFDTASPALSMRLPDGSRLFAVMDVTERPAIAIRRHRHLAVSGNDLVRMGVLGADLRALLKAAVRARRNMIISGGTNVGKTTVLRALAADIPPAERLITIEDCRELALDRDRQAHPDVVTMETRDANIEGEGEITCAELTRWALRMSPDRVIVGEARGGEVIPLLNAMSQGNDGSLATIHASTSQGVFQRIATYAAQAEERLNLEASSLLIAGAVHLVVHLDYDTCGNRVVASIREVTGAEDGRVVSNEIYRPGPDGRAVPAAPIRTDTMDRLIAAGLDPDVLLEMSPA